MPFTGVRDGSHRTRHLVQINVDVAMLDGAFGDRCERHSSRVGPDVTGDGFLAQRLEGEFIQRHRLESGRQEEVTAVLAGIDTVLLREDFDLTLGDTAGTVLEAKTDQHILEQLADAMGILGRRPGHQQMDSHAPAGAPGVGHDTQLVKFVAEVEGDLGHAFPGCLALVRIEVEQRHHAHRFAWADRIGAIGRATIGMVGQCVEVELAVFLVGLAAEIFHSAYIGTDPRQQRSQCLGDLCFHCVILRWLLLKKMGAASHDTAPRSSDGRKEKTARPTGGK